MTEHLGPVAHAALVWRQRMLMSLAAPLKAADMSDDKAFADCVAGLLTAGIEPRRIAVDAKVSIPTVDHWSRGVSAPHLRIRSTIKPILERIVRAEVELIGAIFEESVDLPDADVG